MAAIFILFLLVVARPPPEDGACLEISLCSCGCELSYSMQRAVCAPIVEQLRQRNDASVWFSSGGGGFEAAAAAAGFARDLVGNATEGSCVMLPP